MLSVKSPALEAILLAGNFGAKQFPDRGIAFFSSVIPGVLTGATVKWVQVVNDFKHTPIQTTGSEGHSSRENTQKVIGASAMGAHDECDL